MYESKRIRNQIRLHVINREKGGGLRSKMDAAGQMWLVIHPRRGQLVQQGGGLMEGCHKHVHPCMTDFLARPTVSRSRPSPGVPRLPSTTSPAFLRLLTPSPSAAPSRSLSPNPFYSIALILGNTLLVNANTGNNGNCKNSNNNIP